MPGPYYPTTAAGLSYITYPVGPVADGVQTDAGSANVKGNYYEIAASLPFTTNFVSLFTHGGTNAAGLQYLLDVAIGAAGAEVVVVPNTLVEETGDADAGKFGIWTLPLAIPAGSRVAVRTQCSTGAGQCRVSMTFARVGGADGIGSFVNYGANVADSGGVAVDPGGTVDTKGVYSELTPATSALVQSLTLMNSVGGNTVPQLAIWAIDIATGAAGAEAVLIPDLRIGSWGVATPNSGMLPHTQTFLVYIPAGTRIAVRASCSINDATDRVFDVAFLAGTAPAGGNPPTGFITRAVAAVRDVLSH